MKHSITRRIDYCARCGEDHRNIVFHRFQGNFISSDGNDFQYWGWCPRYLEPIIYHAGENDEDFAEHRTGEGETEEVKYHTFCRCSPECQDSQSSPNETESLPTD